MSARPRSLTVSVGYDDFLKETLFHNASMVESTLVITDHKDERTAKLVEQVSKVVDVRLHKTDAFYRNGARFNRGAAIEEGFDIIGRDNWTLVWDADILFPLLLWAKVRLEELDKEKLYSPWRRILDDPTLFHSGIRMNELPRYPDKVLAGYFQLFHGSASSLADRPWYGTQWQHAADCDSYFCRKFSRKLWQRLDFDVLHFGPPETNWVGRISKRVDGLPIQHQPELEKEMQAMKERRRKFRVGDPRRWEGEIVDGGITQSQVDKIEDSE